MEAARAHEANHGEAGGGLEVLKVSPAHSQAMGVMLILGQGAMNRARLPLSELHARLLAEAEEAGLGNADNSAILEVLRK